MKIGQKIIELGKKIFGKKDKNKKNNNDNDGKIKESWWYLYEPKTMPKIFKDNDK